jgi:hypothetical protein
LQLLFSTFASLPSVLFLKTAVLVCESFEFAFDDELEDGQEKKAMSDNLKGTFVPKQGYSKMVGRN